MLTAAIAILAIVALVNWHKWKISTRALIYYMLTKEYTPPSDKQIEACNKYVIMKMLGR